MIGPAYERTVAVCGQTSNRYHLSKIQNRLGCYWQIHGRGPPIGRPDREYRRETLATVGYIQRERLGCDAAFVGGFFLAHLLL